MGPQFKNKMIKHITKTIKVIKDVPDGYWTTMPPSEEECLDIVERTINKHKAKLIKYFLKHDYVPTLKTTMIPFLGGEQKEVSLADLVFSIKIYMEI